MNADTVGKLNSAGIILRFVTPLMVGVLLAMTGILITSMNKMEFALSNHLTTDMQRIVERLARIEERLEIDSR